MIDVVECPGSRPARVGRKGSGMGERPDQASPRRVWAKVGLVLILPIAATVWLVTNGWVDHADRAKTADRTRDLATVVRASGDLVEGLQNERAAAALLISGEASARQRNYQAAYTQAQSVVTAAVGGWAGPRGRLREVPTSITTTLRQIDEGLAALPDLRSGVAGLKLSFTDEARAYTAVVDDLLALRDSAAQTADPALSERMRAAAAVARGKEHLSRERLVMLQAFSAGAMKPNLRTEFIAAQTGLAGALETFSATATGAEKALYDDTVAGTDLRTAVQFASWVTGVMPADGTLLGAPFTMDSWDSALRANGALIRSVERQLDDTTVGAANTARDNDRREALVEAGVPLAILLLAIVLAAFVARSLTRSRRDLHDGAAVGGGPVDPDRPLARTAASNRP
ncbi:nitrate- and nitrite sensing domain-containing protein [Asanoa sp. NPDC049573]|uniref:nitrate- and nitrite sensing domain-containing protein n=1 Tax=Asanoa sp. NPDC049573 TaxID=3155396 RepID=UPI003443DD3C